jgi:hypothetical protein
MMIINKSKDLQGISMFLTGVVPPQIDFSTVETSIRDTLIRDHFRAFLKNLDFYKGNYFITQDFNSAVLAEAEGLATIYLKKPPLIESYYELSHEDPISVSELIYELSVAFSPLFVEGNGISLMVESDWAGKTLEDWEDWKLRVTWLKDEWSFQLKFDNWLKHPLIAQMLYGWRNLKERYVSWVK